MEFVALQKKNGIATLTLSERTSMDLSKSMADKSCRIPPIGAAGAALRVHALIPNCAQTGGFRSIIREVRII
jgi:hypothetical protein